MFIIEEFIIIFSPEKERKELTHFPYPCSSWCFLLFHFLCLSLFHLLHLHQCLHFPEALQKIIMILCKCSRHLRVCVCVFVFKWSKNLLVILSSCNSWDNRSESIESWRTRGQTVLLEEMKELDQVLSVRRSKKMWIKFPLIYM